MPPFLDRGYHEDQSEAWQQHGARNNPQKLSADEHAKDRPGGHDEQEHPVAGTWLPGAIAFAICLGLGSGINSIAQGNLPLYLFGSVTGKMTAARLAVGAGAPFIFAAVTEYLGLKFALAANIFLAIISVLAFIAVAAASRKHATASA